MAQSWSGLRIRLRDKEKLIEEQEREICHLLERNRQQEVEIKGMEHCFKDQHEIIELQWEEIQAMQVHKEEHLKCEQRLNEKEEQLQDLSLKVQEMTRDLEKQLRIRMAEHDQIQTQNERKRLETESENERLQATLDQVVCELDAKQRDIDRMNKEFEFMTQQREMVDGGLRKLIHDNRDGCQQRS